MFDFDDMCIINWLIKWCAKEIVMFEIKFVMKNHIKSHCWRIEKKEYTERVSVIISNEDKGEM